MIHHLHIWFRKETSKEEGIIKCITRPPPKKTREPYEHRERPLNSVWAGAEQGDGQSGQELVGKSFPGRREVQIKVGMGKEIERETGRGCRQRYTQGLN